MPIGHEVHRGRYYKLGDEVIRQHPQFFAVLIPVNQVLGEIERCGGGRIARSKSSSARG